MKKIAIIPARGGSKRIPRKNIKDFLGKPIIAYSIEAAIGTGIFDTVMVSTDDEEIKSIAIKYGADVPFLRSKKNSDDYATTIDVILEVLEMYQKSGKLFQQGTCLYPTAPLVSQESLVASYEKLNEHQADTVLTITNFSYPIERALRLGNSDKVVFANEENILKRSQDLGIYYHDAGQFYTFNTKILSSKKSLFTDNSFAITLSNMEVQDIDNEDDWYLAELKYQALHRE